MTISRAKQSGENPQPTPPLSPYGPKPPHTPTPEPLSPAGVHEHGAELFTRGVQANAGLGFGVLIFGIAMGALFAVLFCVVFVRVRQIGPRALSALLAAAAFGAVYLVPFVKYPPNPPAVG